MGLRHLHAAAAAAKRALKHRDAASRKASEAAQAIVDMQLQIAAIDDKIKEIGSGGSSDPIEQVKSRIANRQVWVSRREEKDRQRQELEDAARPIGAESIEAQGQMVEAARRFLDAKRDFVDAAHVEFHHELAELPLPQLFRKWYAIVRGIDPEAIGGGILSSLESVRIAPLRGHSRTPAFVDEWRSAWQRDPEMVALNAELLDLAKFGRRMQRVVDEAEEVERFRQKREAERERKRRLAERSQNQIIYSSDPQQPLTIQQLSNLWRAEDAAQRAVEGPATADQQEMEG